ncbi:MAG: hypothetical protein HXY36_07175 [Chloroflexi bacterium]|nr:hypothetical protein [Chloroflexota bacterium]
MSSLRIDGRWDTPPIEAIRVGQHFGFVGAGGKPDRYVFPVAHILSFVGFPTSVASTIVENFPTKGSGHPLFGELARQLIEDGFSEFGDRIRYIVQAREGLLTGTRMTLEQAGSRLHITRERARQLERRFWDTLQTRPGGRSLSRLFSVALLCKVISSQGRLIVHQDSYEACLLGFLAKCAGIPRAVFPHTDLLVLGISPKAATLPKSTDSIHEDIDRGSIAARLGLRQRLCLTKSDLETLAEAVAQFRRGRLNKGQKAYLALRVIGKPAHYSEVTEVYNTLFPSESTAEHSLHTVLSREQYGVVWIGVRGTFALREWGFERPSERLFDAVTNIVQEKYEETSQPVPFAVIVAEMGKRRRFINQASLTIAAHCNPNLARVGKDSFVPKGSAEEGPAETPAEELDRILREFEKKAIKDQ